MQIAEYLKAEPDRMWDFAAQTGVTHAVGRMPDGRMEETARSIDKLCAMRNAFAERGFTLDVCGGDRQLAGSLADIASITNSSSARGVLTVTSSGVWSGEVHPNVGIGVAAGVRFRLGADTTLPANARLYLADGSTLDLDGATRTVRTVYGKGMVVNGTLNETNPRCGAIIIVE